MGRALPPPSPAAIYRRRGALYPSPASRASMGRPADAIYRRRGELRRPIASPKLLRTLGYDLISDGMRLRPIESRFIADFNLILIDWFDGLIFPKQT